MAGIPNAYWIEPRRLIGGAYPATGARTEAIERLERLIDAGITAFIDLTEPGECRPYEKFLPRGRGLNGGDVLYVRKPLGDHKTPRSPQIMRAILDELMQMLTDGHCVYLHCRAGIGRTGTVAGCYLIERGMAPTQAMHHLQHLWEQGGRSSVWPHTPETEEQSTYIKDWDKTRLRVGKPWWQPWKRASRP